MAKRPGIPSDLERDVLIESGHRCAIHTCRQAPVEIAHIVPWARSKEHRFENLIALCPTCHTRFDKGEIDRKSMRIYKQNLFAPAGRYGELERRILQVFAAQPQQEEIVLLAGLEILLDRLLNDGLLADEGPSKTEPNGSPFLYKTYRLTEAGRIYVRSRLGAGQD